VPLALSGTRFSKMFVPFLDSNGLLACVSAFFRLPADTFTISGDGASSGAVGNSSSLYFEPPGGRCSDLAPGRTLLLRVRASRSVDQRSPASHCVRKPRTASSTLHHLAHPARPRAAVPAFMTASPSLVSVSVISMSKKRFAEHDETSTVSFMNLDARLLSRSP